jgi:ABC-type nitrate/sulfonate/bicarbonate transport system ATPase subunit
MAQWALELADIAMAYNRNGRPLVVLERISLTVRPGEFVSIVGPSGSGKSTLFHIIGGLVPPTAGTVRINGEDVTGARGRISYMPQQPALFPWRTVEDNVALAQEVAGRPKAEARALAREWLAKVGLAGFEKAYPHELSGGMQQRASFVRALLSPQELMCLDEPFSALDALTRAEMQRWLLHIWERNRRSVLFVTHSIEEALLLSDRIYLFTNKPTSVLKQLEVPFPRPRESGVTDDPVFLRMKREIYELLQAELEPKREPGPAHKEENGS